MGLTSHLSYYQDDFSSYRIYFSLIFSLTEMTVMTSLTMMVLVPGYLVRALFLFFEISIDRVWVFLVNGVTKSVCWVGGIFSVCIFSAQKLF